MKSLFYLTRELHNFDFIYCCSIHCRKTLEIIVFINYKYQRNVETTRQFNTCIDDWIKISMNCIITPKRIEFAIYNADFKTHNRTHLITTLVAHDTLYC